MPNARSRDDRSPWETAGGPEVGTDVPITSVPRPEEKPGVPVDPSRREDVREAPRPEERAVTVDDPALSREANERLTEEVREVVGAERVTVPSDRPRPSRGERPERRGLDAALGGNRLLAVRTLAVALVIGAILALVTKSWWFLPLAAGFHALGTMTIAALGLRMTGSRERPAPTTVALLEEEGVPQPEQHFSDIVDEFTEDAEAGAPNERTVESGTPAAAAEQGAAMTPTSGPSSPSRTAGVPNAVNWSIVVGLIVLSVVLPAAFGGGWLWAMTAVIVPLAIGWMALQRLTAAQADNAVPRSQATIATVVCLTALAVAGFCAVVALAFQH